MLLCPEGTAGVAERKGSEGVTSQGGGRIKALNIEELSYCGGGENNLCKSTSCSQF